MPNPKTTMSTAILTGVLVIGLGAVAVNYSQQGKPATKLSPAERQKIHSTLYPWHDSGKKLREINPGKDILIMTGPAARVFTRGSIPPKPACVADAIVIGVVKDQSSALTEREAFIFTEYTIAVDKVLKTNPAAPISSGDSIIFTRPGGTLVLDGRKAVLSDEDYPLLHLARRYLLFLRFIPQTGAYGGLRPGPDGVSVDDVSIENPDEKALDQARQDSIGCTNRGGAR